MWLHKKQMGLKSTMSEISDQHEAISYLKHHPVAVLGTVDKHGHPYGAAVFLYASSVEMFYIITKTETQKFKNMTQNPHVSLTVADGPDNSSLQITGTAHVISDADTIEMVMGNMTKIYAVNVDWLPPITKISAGAYQVVGIKPNHIRMSDYKGEHPGSRHIFTEVEA